MIYKRKIVFFNYNKVDQKSTELLFDSKSNLILDDRIKFNTNNQGILIPYYLDKNLVSKYNINNEAKNILTTLSEKLKNTGSKTSLIFSVANPEVFLSNDNINILCIEFSNKLLKYYKDYLLDRKVSFEEIDFNEIEKYKEFFEQQLLDENSSCSFIINNLSKKDFLKFLQYIPEKEIEIYTNPVLKNLFEYKNIENLSTQNLRRKIININTAKRFSTQWSKNFLQNSIKYLKNKGVEPLIDLLNNKIPVLIVGAGSSVDDDINIIKRLCEICLVIVLDTALIPLLKLNIIPDIIVSSDSQSVNALYTTKSHINDYDKIPILVTMPTVHPKLIEYYKGKIAFSSIPFALVKDIESFSKGKIEIGAGGTVFALALELSILLNPSDIILSGIDFCYSNGKLHCNHALFDFLIYGKVNYIYSYQTFITKSMLKANSFITVNEYGIKTRTDPKFLLFLDWFKSQINLSEKKNRIYFINKKSYGISNLSFMKEDAIDKLIEEKLKDKINKIKISEILEKVNFEEKEENLFFEKYLSYLEKTKIEALTAQNMIQSVLKRIDKEENIHNESFLRFFNTLESNLINFNSLKRFINMSFQNYLLEVQYEKKEIDTISFYKNLLKQIKDNTRIIEILINRLKIIKEKVGSIGEGRI